MYTQNIRRKLKSRKQTSVTVIPELPAEREGMAFWKAEATPFLRLMAHGSSSGWVHTCCTLPSTTATTSGYLSSVLAALGP